LNTAAILRAQGEGALAREVEDFVKAMPGVRTEKEQIAAGLLAQVAVQRQREHAPAGPEPTRIRRSWASLRGEPPS
jgi:hypothetical protein